MNISDTERKSRSESADSSTPTTRLSGPWLIIARVVWLALVVPSVGLFVAGLPVFYQQIQKPCVDPVTCNLAGALTAKGLQGIPALGFSVSGYVAFFTIFWAINAAIWSGIGFLIFWRRSDDWLALLAAFFLVRYWTSYPGFAISALPLVYPPLDVPTTLMSVLGQYSIVLFILLFPNGRLVPRWMGLFLLLGIIPAVSAIFPPTSPFNLNNFLGWFSVPFNLVPYGAAIFSQIYRYRRVSTPIQRQQTKWVVFGIVIVLTGLIVLDLLFNVFFPALNQPDTPSSSIANIAYPLLILLLPVSIGIAILRYRLYDIDVLINRTLVYGTLTVLLALVYFGLVIGLQALFHWITGQVSQSPVAIVASTLAIFALFQPLRHRIQAIIDRRFYRRKYDAAKILEAFSATLRSEVDLQQLHEHLLNVVQETMQPAHVSLWLRPTQQDGERNTWKANPLTSHD